MKDWRLELNENQRKAAEYLEGPLLILAGAGSGKTKTMTHRICHMLESGIPASSILAITFTNKAADEMKKRVEEMINEGEEEPRSVPLVCTFHSFGVKVMRRFGHLLGYKNKITICDEDDREKRIKDIVKILVNSSKGKDEEKDAQTIKIMCEEVSNLISRFKDECIVPSQTNTFELKEGEVYPFLEIAKQVYPVYEKQLFSDSCVDFDDLIEKPVLLFEHFPEVRRFFNEMYSYISVDEYQDTSKCQAQLVSFLAGEKQNVCVVGDDYQSIYAFRGAIVDNILNFADQYNGCRTIVLKENYRSTQNIVDASAQVIANNKKQFKKNLESMNEEGALVQVREYERDRQEADAIASKIKKAKESGLKYSEIAILYRTNAMSRIYEDALIRENIPYKIYGGVSFYDRQEIKDLVAYLKIASGYDDTMALKRIANVPKRKLGEKSVSSMLNVVREDDSVSLLKRLEQYAVGNPKFSELFSLLNKFHEDAKTVSLSTLLIEIIDTIKYEDHLKAVAKTLEVQADKKENIYELVNKAASFTATYTRDDSLKYESEEITPLEILDAFLEEISLLTDAVKDSSADSVSLMTMHKSKGLEFNTVFVAGCEEPGSGIPDEEIEESRRLFYVSMTRAKKKLYISYAESRITFGKEQFKIPLRFVREIPEENKKFKHIEEKKKYYFSSYSGKNFNSLRSKIEKPWWE